MKTIPNNFNHIRSLIEKIGEEVQSHYPSADMLFHQNGDGSIEYHHHEIDSLIDELYHALKDNGVNTIPTKYGNSYRRLRVYICDKRYTIDPIATYVDNRYPRIRIK